MYHIKWWIFTTLREVLACQPLSFLLGLSRAPALTGSPPNPLPKPRPAPHHYSLPISRLMYPLGRGSSHKAQYKSLILRSGLTGWAEARQEPWESQQYFSQTRPSACLPPRVLTTAFLAPPGLHPWGLPAPGAFTAIWIKACFVSVFKKIKTLNSEWTLMVSTIFTD